QVHQPLHRQSTGKVTQRMSAHAIGDRPESLLWLVQTGILVNLADAAGVGTGCRGPPEGAGSLQVLDSQVAVWQVLDFQAAVRRLFGLGAHAICLRLVRTRRDSNDVQGQRILAAPTSILG